MEETPFIRAPESLSPATWERAQSAKYRLESFYTSFVNETFDRENR